MSNDSTSLLMPLFVVLYFVPYFVAYQRNHNNSAPIFLTTLFLGWTVIGWIVALIWSFSDNTRALTARQ